MRNNNNTHLWSEFKRLRNHLKNTIRDKRRRFMIEMSENIRSNAKRFWTFCRLKTKFRLMPAVLCSGNEEAISSEDKCIMFNNYFHSVFNNNTSTLIFQKLMYIWIQIYQILYSLRMMYFECLKSWILTKEVALMTYLLGSYTNVQLSSLRHWQLFSIWPCRPALCQIPASTLLLYQYIKREINVKLTIIDPFHCLMVLAKLWSD